MYEVRLYDKVNKKVFTKVFNTETEKINFVRKCKYSKKLEVIATIDNTFWYD